MMLLTALAAAPTFDAAAAVVSAAGVLVLAVTI